MKASMRAALAWIVSGLAASVPPPAIADETPWPSKPIRLIVPGGPGSARQRKGAVDDFSDLADDPEQAALFFLPWST